MKTHSPSGERQPVPLGHVNPSPLLAGCSFPSIERMRLRETNSRSAMLTAFVSCAVALALVTLVAAQAIHHV